ncbi:bifunctional enoyl-CoA hydratase/phosphate acetyltransferase [Komagataeibacter diospyri]|uniref:bifunctional enoyl-CoA hydratase/phosphate acetyltransferase n=1 Tax=Komagataeibacter diospyri TaxID=1932662 RepID=UPI0037570DC3
MNSESTDDIPVFHGRRHRRTFEKLIAEAEKSTETVSYAVVWPCDSHALAGAVVAAKRGIIRPILIGDIGRIREVAQCSGIETDGIDMLEARDPGEAAKLAVKAVHSGHAHGIMKGSIHTDILMHEIVDPENGLLTTRRMSHVYLLTVPGYKDVIFITDAAVNISPDLAAKRDIVQNAIDLHHGLGLGVPRVALLSAIETVNPRVLGTVDAAALCKMAERGQIKGALLDGPLAMDNAIDKSAARIKGIVSKVAGHAQILVAPDLEAGNMLAKSLIFMAHADSAGVVLGAKVPILLTSRADNVVARLTSAAVGSLYSAYLQKTNHIEN